MMLWIFGLSSSEAPPTDRNTDLITVHPEQFISSKQTSSPLHSNGKDMHGFA
jgi:hypothetical protein